MRWMMLGLAASGALAYGLVFLSQSQHETAPEAVAATADPVEEIEPVAPPVESPATLPPVAVSNPVTPAWTGDPWPAGVRFYQAGEYGKAVDALAAAVQEKEDSAYRHYLLGLAYLKHGETEGAVEELGRSLELRPGNVRALVNLGRAHLVREEYPEARDAVDLALEADLDDVDAWNVLGRVELSQGALEPAEAAFTRAVEKDSTHVWAWNNLGYARILGGKFAAALTPMLAATQQAPDVAIFQNNLGVVLERLEDLDGARDAFAAARDLGHGTAGGSFARIDHILVARGDAAATPEEDTELVAANE